MKYVLFFIITVLLSAITFAQTDTSELTSNAIVENAFKDIAQYGTNTMVTFSSRENIRGSRYLFPNWVKGSVTDKTNTNYNNPAYFFNYDKISYHLFMTTDKKDVIELDPENIKAFTLSNDAGAIYAYEKIPVIDPAAFLQVIKKDTGNYSAYKLTKTKFEKANYHTDGMVETGKNYDEYADEYQYYIVFKNSAYKKVELIKKSLVKALSDNQKAATYFKDHKDDDVNESYLLELITFLDKN